MSCLAIYALLHPQTCPFALCPGNALVASKPECKGKAFIFYADLGIRYISIGIEIFFVLKWENILRASVSGVGRKPYICKVYSLKALEG